jgi:cell division protein FtsW
VASHGSERWAVIGGLRLMPSDIMKPGLVVMTAWFLAKMKEKFGSDIFLNPAPWRPAWLSWWTYLVPFGLVLLILFQQPDIGTTLLFMAVVGTMLFIAGLPRKIWLPLLGLFGGVGFLAFLFVPHVHRRVLEFIKPLDPTTQVGYSVNAIRQGGLFGMGDEAFAKESLPDAHTDFIFAALAEDWGAIMACGLLVLLLVVIRRLTVTAMSARDTFVFYAVGGTTALFATQICINLATTLGLMPPKGMTLPFISSGGSSFLGYCLLFGMILAIVREDKWK